MSFLNAPINDTIDRDGKGVKVNSPTWVLWLSNLVSYMKNVTNNTNKIIYTDVAGSGRQFVINGVKINNGGDGTESIEIIWKEVV